MTPVTVENPSSLCSDHDNELKCRVQLFLQSSNLPSLRHVRVEIDGDAVVLDGPVRTYYEKQMAVQFASRVAGVVRVVDRIVVRSYIPLTKRTRGERGAGRRSVMRALYGA